MKGNMMNRMFVLFFLLCITLYAKPMESIERYNIVLVHGAADSLSGMDCDASDVDEAYSYYDPTKEKADVFGRMQGYVKETGALWWADESRSTATGMMKTLPDWINDNILDGEQKDRFGIYLNRPFLNPANTPVVNGGEIGNRAWKGRDNCKSRRSLIEEAEEMRNWGRDSLVKRRNDNSMSYRKYKNDVGFHTHRNILIAHSMGGLASREYVQSDYYNDDVDKVITLDSPHRGTYSLDGLLDMKRYASNFFVESVLQETFLYATAAITLQRDPLVNNTALVAMGISFLGLNAINAIVDAVVDVALGYNYSATDPLVDYVQPTSEALKTLNSKVPTENTPMFRILYAVGGLTFGSNTEYGQNIGSIFIPDALYAMVKNGIAQASHTELENPGYLHNIVSSATLGAVGGLSLTDHGSILIPHWSGAGEEVAVFEKGNSDFVRIPFKGNEHADNDYALGNATGVLAASLVSLYACEALNVFSTAAVVAAKIAVGVATGYVLVDIFYPTGVDNYIPPVINAIRDMTENHKNPSQADWHEKQKEKRYSYVHVDGSTEKVESYLLENMLYEKPFVNVAVYNENDWTEIVDSTKMDSIGFFNGDASLCLKTMKEIREEPLLFHSASDWNEMGVKVERWSKVVGTDGDSIPIRHVERYNLPKIVVTDFIDKYSFVVDDFMPHRLRQIRMNFNFQTEIAWECDITMDPKSDSACVVYADKSDGKGLQQIGKVPHPVEKNGDFVFVPANLPDPAFKNLSYFQKDNQNVVTISTVNKIGLSNTQRFFYLAKMTEDLYEPKWPLPNIVVTGVDNFTLKASILDYQGFRIDSTCTDFMFVDTAFTKDSAVIASAKFNKLRMGFSTDGKGATLTSAQKNDSLPEGHYIWQNNIVVMNDTSRSEVPYVVPFSVDRTPPQIELYLDRNKLNPDSTRILARIVNSDSTQDIRAMRAYISKWNGNRFEFRAKLPSLYDVSSPNFALFCDSSLHLDDGKHRLDVFAFDRALPNYDAYEKVGKLVEKILAGTDSEADWNGIDLLSLNKVRDTIVFYVDRTAPEYTFRNVESEKSATSATPFTSLTKTGGFVYVGSQDKLKISYNVKENGDDSLNAVKLYYAFMHWPDTTVADRFGDSVTIVSANGYNGNWLENDHTLIPDGDYRIKVTAVDEAGNQSTKEYGNIVRVDRTAPNIETLVATKLVYSKGDSLFGAKLVVNEKHDVEGNRSGFRCYSRITSAKKSSSWDYIDETFVDDTVRIELNASDVDTTTGKRYLDVGCVDIAGNVSYMTDLFYVGEQYPEITSPTESTNDLDGKILVIRGIAAAPDAKYETTARYELSYKCIDDGCDDSWRTEGISKRDSNKTQPVEGILGFWNREKISGTYLLKLDMIPCDTCQVLSDSVVVSLQTYIPDYSDPQVVFQVPDTVYVDSAAKILYSMKGDSISNYSVRVYGYDSNGVALFDDGTDRIKENPFYGTPVDTSKAKGIWFYGDSMTWTLKWKGLLADSLEIRYDSTSISISCLSKINGCKQLPDSSDIPVLPSSVSSLMEAVPEHMPNTEANTRMILTGNSGSINISGESPFSIHQAMDTSLVLPVYFGSHKEGGFYGVDSMLVYSWTVDCENYMFKKEWNGLSDARTYPAGGLATIYAEAVEKVAAGSARVLLDSAKVFLILPDLKVVLPSDTLPPFKLFKLPNTVKRPDSTSTSDISYVVGKMSANYGIRGRKAYVSAYVTDPDGSVITVFENELKNAGPNNAAYTLVWNGMKEKDHPVTKTGTYKLTITATEAYPADPKKPQTDFIEKAFELVVANNLEVVNLEKENSNGLWFDIREAVDDSMYLGQKYYEPIADYLVSANVSGYGLPAKYQKSFDVKSRITGTQNAIGFKPERFSLGIKRQRERLDLVVVYKINRYTESCYDWFDYHSCETTSGKIRPVVGFKGMTFTTALKTDTISLDIEAGNNYGYSYEKTTEIDLYAVLYKDWESYIQTYGWNNDVDNFNNLKAKNVWSLNDASEGNVYLEKPEQGGYREFGPKSTGLCKPDTLNETGNEKQCQCDLASGCKKGTSDDYNPNKSLFRVEFIGKNNTNFFYNEKYLKGDTRCKNTRFYNMALTIQLSIPDSYWNAGFGYDNLVNRTIRFDGTNKSIYNTGVRGYMAALQTLKDTSTNAEVVKRTNNFFDGDEWVFDMSYGKLTPYETQHLPFFSASIMPGAVNTFLFPDETPDFMYPSYYEVKFYNDDAASANTKHFVAMIHGWQNGVEQKFLWNSVVRDSLKTSLLDHGNVDFYVSLNKSYGAQTADTIKYVIPNPAPHPDTWKKLYETDTLKFYAMGSKVHYYPGDFGDDAWANLYLTSPNDGGYFKNLMNFKRIDQVDDPVSSYSFAYWKPDSLVTLNLDSALIKDSSEFSTKVALRSTNYDSLKHAFFLTPFGLSTSASAGMKYEYDFTDSVHLKVSNDTLYCMADSTYKPLVYRRTTSDPLPMLPTPTDTINLDVNNMIRYSNLSPQNKSLMNGEWFKERRVTSAKLSHLDSSEHSHFEVLLLDSTSNNLVIKYKDSVELKRPHEYVEMAARLNSGVDYDISYLKDSVFHYIGTFEGSGKKERLKWFDVNHLQGNTSFILTWGGQNGSSDLNYAQYDLNVGTSVGSSDDKTVKSLLGEVSVSFGSGSMDEFRRVTVRTTSAEEHQFDVFNNAALTGPIIEVLPSMEFTDSTKYPRIQMKISKKEIEQAGLTPDRVRLYKVDFKNGQFVPLSHVLYGYVTDKGLASVDGANLDSATCEGWDNPNCYDADNWAYMLISGETATFSIFAALDSVKASLKIMTMEVLPEVSMSLEREIRVIGADDFDLYLDSTLQQKLPWHRDSLGRVMVTLPNQDSIYIYGVAKNGSGDEGMAKPARVLAWVAPVDLVCNIPVDTLWLGLDNGYLEFYPNCNQHGSGIFSIHEGSKGIASVKGDMRDTLKFDGKYSGLKVKDGSYLSRYQVSSVVSHQAQFAGPTVVTDSARPVIMGFVFNETSLTIDRVFDVQFQAWDNESGIKDVKLIWILGNDTLKEMSVLPDSSGNVSTSMKVTRYAMDKCLGCNLTVSVHAQDFGHNHADTLWRSGKLFPYPTELALWYPAHEGSGKIAYEFTGTDHHLNLFMFRPWLSGSGLYFYHPADSAVGVGHVDLGTSSEYSLEARINPGNAQDTLWRRIMGFEGTSGLKIELQNQGSNLRLVEGGKMWTLRGNLPSNAWSHVVVAVDTAEVCFYIDGTLIYCDASVARDREFYGTFSMGERVAQNFVGNVSDIRLYTKALNRDEVLALTQPIKDERDTSEIHTIIVLGNEMEGADRQFSCAVSGNGYFVGNEQGLKMSAYIPASAEYRAFVYARSARESSSTVKIGVEGSAVYSGSVKLENTWRPVEIAGVKLPLNSGMQKLIVNVPEGVQIAGIALTNGDMVEASQISWKSDRENAGGKLAAKSKVKSSVRFEGYPEDKTMLRPRIRLVNVSDEAVNGFKVRYYFRGEAPEMVHADGYLPQKDTAGLTVNGESFNTGYVEWSLDTTQILPGRSPYFGEGPLMGIYNEGYAPWYAEDDPSYVLPGSAATDADGFISDFGVVVLDADNNLIGGSCVEMEDPIEVLPPSVRVVAADVRDDQLRGSEIALKVENIGNMALRNYDVRYYFQVEEGIQPKFDVYNWTTFVDGANMEFLGDGRYQVNIHVGNKPLNPHNVWPDEFKFALHENNWEPLWNTSDDPSHNGLSKSYAVTANICVYDSTGKKIYGEDPVWKEPKYVAKSGNEDSLVVDNGYDSGVYVPIIRTPEGLLVQLDGYPYVQLDLVYANGVPIRNIFTGTVMPGGQFIAVEWNGVDLKHTYLVLRRNSQIVSTKLLSTL